ncbi:MAG: PBSX family phage terminase large subunit [Ruminococcaceae bacterium]|nr:PBSX family phage terminase large subunit [Oscillospiraceae bacterium]
MGGRGSTKSTFASIEVVLLLKKHPDCHAIVLRKVGETLRDSVYAQYMWAIERLGLENEFICRLKPLEIIKKSTGQRILFRGADDRAKLKSIKLPFGYTGITHFEEKDQFDSRAEIRSILQSTMRGGCMFWNFETNNPPVRPAHWANRDALLTREGKCVHNSDYSTVPREWLGEQFFIEAEILRTQNETAYRHEYLGEAVGMGSQVFYNLALAEISDAEVKEFDRIYCGVDWGYAPDPFAFVKLHFDAARRTIFIYDEFVQNRVSNSEAARILYEEHSVDGTALLTADSAEPKSIADFKASGLPCVGAVKGAGSVEYSMKWLCGAAKIVIDPVRCPCTAKEFSEYEFDRNKAGEIMTGYPDKNNHCIDAVRYATWRIWRRTRDAY